MLKVSLFASNAIGFGFAPGLAIPKTIINMVQIAFLLGRQALGKEFGSATRLCVKASNCLWGYAL